MVKALLLLSLSCLVTGSCRHDDGGSRPRRIGVMTAVLACASRPLNRWCAGDLAGTGWLTAGPKPRSSGQLIGGLGGGGTPELC
jgi:hypothetical protein